MKGLIEDYQKKFDKKLTKLAKQAKVNVKSLYKWRKERVPSNSVEYNKLITFLEEKLEINPKIKDVREEAGDFGNPLYKTAFLRLPLKSKRPPLPNTDSSLVPGYIVNQAEEPELIVYRLNAPFLVGVEGALPVPDESMYPTYLPGSFVALERVPSFADIRFGECYYIVPTSGKGFIRRVYQSNDPKKFKLVPDNQSGRFPVDHFDKEKIEGMLSVYTEINNPRQMAGR